MRDALLEPLLDAFLDRLAAPGLDDVLRIHEKLLVVGRLLGGSSMNQRSILRVSAGTSASVSTEPQISSAVRTICLPN
ncbi:MAG TPA: hypothetical protein VGD37_00430 [Kofleriaceae bacterium]